MNGMETQERTVPQIELRGLSKVYQIPGGEVQALNNINLAIEQGDIYGIIGMSGAGKSTLIRCLNRLDTPTDGQVLIDGQNILAMSKKQLLQTRRRMAMIFQQFNLLMQKNVARNVRYPLEIAGAPKKQANERVMELLKIVGLEEKANAYPAHLSGGQTQLLTIARALRAGRPLRILDEATSNVDTRTEILVQKAMDKLMKGRTCFVIAHRLSTIVDADLILVLDHGHIVEQGTHGQLLAKKGFYYDLYTSQYAV